MINEYDIFPLASTRVFSTLALYDYFIHILFIYLFIYYLFIYLFIFTMPS